MYIAVVVDKDNRRVSASLVLNDDIVTSGMKTRVTLLLRKLGYKPDRRFGGWDISRISPHWVLRGKYYRRLIKDGEPYKVYLVPEYHSEKVEAISQTRQGRGDASLIINGTCKMLHAGLR